MRIQRRRFVLVASGLVVAVATAVAVATLGSTAARALDPNKAPEIQERLFDATADIELGVGIGIGGGHVSNFQPQGGANECSTQLGSNVKVNQNCLNISDSHLQGRAQAENETSIAVNPNNPNQAIATYNDYRRGDGTCGTSYSNNGGNQWQDSTLPNGFVLGSPYGGAAREYFQASGDPSVAWDSKGNAYYSCQEFQRGTPTTNNPDFSSAIYLYRSTGNGGASWGFPGTAVITDNDTTGATLIDKPYMTVDNHVGSPFRDRIYVAWTLFASDGTAYIYEAFSSDYGKTFSAPVLASSTSAACAYDYSAQGVTPSHGPCDENQFADPFTGPDGTLYIVYNNYNNSEVAGAENGTSADNVNQFLISVSHDGGQTFSAPQQVAKYYDLPDCDTYQGTGADPGRGCVPEQGSQKDSVFRATNYASGAVNPTNPSQAIIAFGSYVNSADATGCRPAGFAEDGVNQYNGVKTSGCGNKILYSISNNANSASPTFSDTGRDPRTDPLVTADPKQAGSDQFWQWSAFNKDGKYAVSYYDRQYGNDETTGNMDITLTSSKDQNHVTNFQNEHRVTQSSMPLPTDFPNTDGNGSFLGDYTGLAAWDQAQPLWSDTRDQDLFDCGTSPPAVCTGTEEPNGIPANDEDIFSDHVGL